MVAARQRNVRFRIVIPQRAMSSPEVQGHGEHYEKSKDPFKDETMMGDYKIGKVLGQGSFGQVKLGIHKETGKKVTFFETMD